MVRIIMLSSDENAIARELDGAHRSLLRRSSVVPFLGRESVVHFILASGPRKNECDRKIDGPLAVPKSLGDGRLERREARSCNR